MTSTKPPEIDYVTLLGYVQKLGIRVYDMSQVHCPFHHDDNIGQGGSIVVFSGYLDNDTDTPSSELIPVALKIPSISIKENTLDKKISEALNDVRQEIRMMKHFDGHPNIIKLYGVAFRNLNPITIVELATEGSITEYLAIRKDNKEPLGWNTKARFCHDVVTGLRALHAADIVHGD